MHTKCIAMSFTYTLFAPHNHSYEVVQYFSTFCYQGNVPKLVQSFVQVTQLDLGDST